MRIKGFSPRQLQLLTWWSDSSPYRDCDAVICDGAVRSGKTLCMGLSFVLWAMRRFDGRKFGICGQSVVSLRRNLIDELLPMLRRFGFSCRERLSDNRIVISCGRRRNTFFLFGGGDEGGAARIQGVTLAGVLLDEAALMARSFVEQAVARCSVDGSRLWFNCNPGSTAHWFYREWILRAAERNALYLRFRMEDNPTLSPAMLRRYMAAYSGAFRKRFVLGEWADGDGRIYDFFREDMAVEAPPGECSRFVVSCDYGTANPASFGLWGLCGGVWYRIAEYYYDSRRAGRQRTDGEYAAELLALCGGRKIEAVICDPSAASFMAELRRAGLNVVRAKNDVLSGIRLTAELLRRGRIVICRACRDTLREIALYSWEEGEDRPRKRDDHAMDDMRYFASTWLGAPEPGLAALPAERRSPSDNMGWRR